MNCLQQLDNSDLVRPTENPEASDLEDNYKLNQKQIT
jgi:hypothetical protein